MVAIRRLLGVSVNPMASTDGCLRFIDRIDHKIWGQLSWTLNLKA